MSSKKIITIHQPDFMPWLGFFNKVSKTDFFVILDHVSNNPKDGSWFRRVKMMIGGIPSWLTIPLIKPEDKLFVPINEMKIKNSDENFVKKTLQTIQLNYKKAPYFNETMPYVLNYFNSKNDLLSERNTEFILAVLNKLEIKCSIVYSSNLNCEQKATELLIEICKKLDADIYICGTGASGYQQDELFLKNNIKLEYNNFQHPVYTQFNSKDFFSGLSIVDALMNCGFEGVKKILKLVH